LSKRLKQLNKGRTQTQWIKPFLNITKKILKPKGKKHFFNSKEKNFDKNNMLLIAREIGRMD